MYVASGSGASTNVGYIDTALETYTFLANVGLSGSGRRALHVASDATYIYHVSGREPTVDLYQIAIVGGAQTLLASTTDNLGDIDLTQKANGVLADFRGVTGYSDGYYYLFEGALTFSATGTDTPPYPLTQNAWDASPTELYAVTGYDPLIYNQQLVPNALGECYASYTSKADSIATAYTWTVTTYPLALQSLLAYEPDKVFVGIGSYGGLCNIDTNTLSNETVPRVDASRIQFVEIPDGRILTSGYPSQGIFISDPTVSPLAITALGYGNTLTSGHYTHGMCYLNGLVYFVGIQHRVGDSGCIGWFDPDDFAGAGSGGFSDEADASLLDYGFRNCVVINDTWIAVSTYLETGTLETTPQIFIFDTTTKTFSKTIGISASLNTGGQIVAVSTTEIVGVTRSPTEELVIYKINVVTNAVEWIHTITGLKHAGLEIGPSSVLYDCKLSTNGKYVYANVAIGTFEGAIIRINIVNGGVELVGTTVDRAVFTLDDVGTLYKVKPSTERVEKVTGLATVNNMPLVSYGIGAEIVPTPNFDSDVNWQVDANMTLDTVAGTLTLAVATNGIQTADYAVPGAVVIGDKFQVTVTIDATNGNGFGVKYGGTVSGFAGSVGTFTNILTATSTDQNILIQTLYSGGTFVISSLSIKKIVNLLA